MLFALLLVLPVAAEGQPIRLRSRVIDTRAVPAALSPASVPTGPSAPVSGLNLIQFTGPFRASWIEELQVLGVRLLRYVPENAYVARLDRVEPERLLALDYVRWLGPLKAEDKLLPGFEASSDEGVRVLLAADVADQEVDTARGLLARVDRESHSRFGTLLQGTAVPGDFGRLLNSDSVLWVESIPRMRLLGEIGSKVVGGDDGATNTPTLSQALGYDGSGVTVAVVDTGLGFGEAQFGHPDLDGRVQAMFAYGGLPSAADEHGHGTHVAGILAGNGAVGETDASGFRYGLGVAPEASLVIQRIFDGLGDYHPPDSFASLVRDGQRAGAEIGSNSWGDETHGRYDLSAMEFDALVRDTDPSLAGDQPFVLSFSAGNAGPGAQTIYSPAVAKNVIAIGASQNNHPSSFFYADGPDAMADFSSRGPCEDGRLKPDLVAPGTWIASARSGLAPDESFWGTVSPNYAYMGGTSQSAPHASGAAAVFIQYYRDITEGDTPSPALVKAALINSAADMADSAGTAPTPNADEGWGRIDLERLFVSPRNYHFEDQTSLLQTGEVHEERVLVKTSEQALKVTLVYTDVPGFPGAIPALVNDLDLVVVGPDGRTYHGNQFIRGESVPARPLGDRVNNVEGVHLATPESGEYRIQVRAQHVAEDALQTTAAIDQDFALVVSGTLAEVDEGVLYLDRAAYGAPAPMRIRLVNPVLTGSDSVAVRVTSDTEPEGEIISLIAEADSTGFTNTVSVLEGSPILDDQLQVSHGDRVRVSEASASIPPLNEALALVDLLPPVISNVALTNEFGAMRIGWTTDEPTSGTLYYGETGQLNSAATNALFALEQEITLKNLTAGMTYECLILATDRAGNTSTNDNNGVRFVFVVPQPQTVLLVNAYTPDEMGYGMIDIPVTSYTEPLERAGVGYAIWSTHERGAPQLEDLLPHQVVMWRYNDNPLSSDKLSLPDQEALTAYIAQGGSLFIAGMELLTRIGDVPFRREVLKVESFSEDAGVPTAVGVSGDPITDQMTLPLDYTVFDSAVLQFLGQTPDVADTMTIASDAVPIFVKASSGAVVGLRHPRTGGDQAGRVVYLSYPIEAVSTNAESPNARADLFGRALEFLAPGAEGVASLTLDRSAYTLPSVVICELGDQDLAGQPSVDIQVYSDSTPEGHRLTLQETLRAGVFQGSFTLTEQTGNSSGVQVAAQPGDRLWASFEDVSNGATVIAAAEVDTEPVVITGVVADASYQSSIVRWETSEPADTLVQIWESAADLPVNRTVYRQDLATAHSITIQGLEPDRSYYFQVVSRDQAGNVSVDSNQGQLYSFRTLAPLTLPWADDLEGGVSGWSVISVEDSEMEWTAGLPTGAPVPSAHSPTTVWSSNPGGGERTFTQTFLLSPAIYLDGDTSVSLSFWHAYDFSLFSSDILNSGQLFLVPAQGESLIALRAYSGHINDWQHETVDLTPYLGQVVHLAWYYELATFDVRSRPGWVIDTIAITPGSEGRASLQILSSLEQTRVTVSNALTGIQLSAEGAAVTVSNLAFGIYTVVFEDVPFYETPPRQNVNLQSADLHVIQGVYGLTDANENGMADTWELQHFEQLSDTRDDTMDTDGDRASDYAEFVAGTNPQDPTSTFSAPAPGLRPDGQLQLTWPSSPGRAYRVESSTDLITWTAETDWMRAEGSLTILPLPPGGTAPTRVFRIQVHP